MRHLLPLLLLLLVAALSASCGTAEDPKTMAPPAADAGFDPAPFQRKTTSAAIAMRNLDATIAAQERALRARPGDRSLTAALSATLLSRSQFRGTYGDLDRVLELAEASVADAPGEAWALDLRANAYQAVHRFDDAERDLAAAAALDGQERADARSTIHLARGQNLEGVLRGRRERASSYPTFRNHSAVAAALGALGRYEDADRAWVAALGAYRDVSPLPVAYVAFQRGVMWSEQAGRSDRGIALYREAVKRLPTYTVANVHLAELEASVDRDAAIARLRRTLPMTADPEPAGLLAELLADVDSDEARGLVQQARSDYEVLLHRHPLAFLDHGAEFFLGAGADPARAVELARANLENRGNARAFEIAIDAARQAGDRDAECSFTQSARNVVPTVSLSDSLAASSCAR